MKTEKQYFNEAISLEQYMDKMEKHKEESFRIYEQFEVPEDDEFIELLKEKKPNILVITEDWCGDAMMNNPVLRRIAEAADLDVRAVYRDTDTDLIDRHLTNGGRSIPVYLFLDENGEVEAKWGPRAAQSKNMLWNYEKRYRQRIHRSTKKNNRNSLNELLQSILPSRNFG